MGLDCRPEEEGEPWLPKGTTVRLPDKGLCAGRGEVFEYKL